MIFVGMLVAVAAEVAAFWAVADQIHFLPALLLLIGVSACGPLIVKRVGAGALARARSRLAKGEPPAGEVLDGLVALAGGLLVCVPGFVGDAIGLVLVIAPLRRVLIGLAGPRLARRAGVVAGWRSGYVDAPTRERPGGAPPGRLPPGGLSPGGEVVPGAGGNRPWPPRP